MSKPTKAELAALVERYRLALHDARGLADEYRRLDTHRRRTRQTRAEPAFIAGIEAAAAKATKHLLDLDRAFWQAWLASVPAQKRQPGHGRNLSREA